MTLPRWITASARTVSTGLAAAGCALALSVPASAAAPPADTTDPDTPRTWVVGMGDSYMSGEGASWIGKNYAGNDLATWRGIGYGVSLEQSYPGDYSGQPGGMCHRSASAAMFLGSGTTGKNLACSGARTYSATNADGVYKPGIDFDNGNGQAAQLQTFAGEVTAAGDDLPVIMVSIGGNDAGFADVIAYCAKQFVIPLASACWKGANDPSTPVGAAMASLPTVTNNVAKAFTNIKTALDAAGRPVDSYTIVYQLPPLVVPAAADMWPALGGDHGWGRQDYGGCPFTDGDLTFFRSTLGPKLNQAMVDGLRQAQGQALAGVNVIVLEPTYTGHELCSKINPPKDNGPQVNTTTPAYDQFSGQGGSWATPIIMNCVALNPNQTCARDRYPTIMASVSNRVADMATLPAHPNYWGQRALAACHDLIDRNAEYRGSIVSCAPSTTVPLPQDSQGRPVMTVTGDRPLQ